MLHSDRGPDNTDIYYSGTPHCGRPANKTNLLHYKALDLHEATVFEVLRQGRILQKSYTNTGTELRTNHF